MDDIDVSLLRSFVAVAETGRMTTAAKVVNRSQGAVSQQIKRLEDLFRAPLFERHAAAVRLTRSGERLMVAAHRIIALNDEVMNQMLAVEFAGEASEGDVHQGRHISCNVIVTVVASQRLYTRRQIGAGRLRRGRGRRRGRGLRQ